ncbi:hypothetical protein BKI52_36085 [marine bacterium AO1-C]|nr:hypothetical protein BKI52_36085 [marine bacterium AO1-C]
MKTIIINLICVICLGVVGDSQAQPLQPFLGSNATHFGLMNNDYEVVVPAQYTFLLPKDYGFWVQKGPKKQGVLSSEGKEIIPLKYDRIERWSGKSLVKVANGGLWGVANTQNGQVIFKPQFKQIYWAYQETAIVKGVNGLEGIIKTNGEILVKPAYQDIWGESDGFRVVQNQQGKYGFLNTQGKLVIACKYDKARGFRDKFAKVAIGKQWYYINRYGVLVNKATPPPWEGPPEEPTEPVYEREIAYPNFKGLRGNYKSVWSKQDLQQNFLTYAKNYMRASRAAQQEKLEGVITLQFVVSEKGRLYHIKVLKGLADGFDKEAIRLLKRLGKWSPARFSSRKIASLQVINIPCVYKK